MTVCVFTHKQETPQESIMLTTEAITATPSYPPSSRLMHPISLSEATARVERIDLAVLKLKLCNSSEGPGWSHEYYLDVEREYRRFIIMNLIFPDRKMAPSKDVDEMWHYHILDTRKYASDCEQHIGVFLHHFPYLGLRGGSDPELLALAGNATLDSYVEAFGEQPRADVWWARVLPTDIGAAHCANSCYCSCNGD
jgi:hypothetical protein